MMKPAPNVPIPDHTGTGNQLVLALPVFNAEEFLPATLESLNAQGPDLRWWLQDGASTDRTVEIARSFAREGDTVRIVEALKARFPQIVGPKGEDICYATSNRQAAVKRIAPNSDLVLVIGAPNSSNSVRLVEVAERCGATARRS
jgi:glycosyltransferase involved in cell wall biosynthesis